MTKTYVDYYTELREQWEKEAPLDFVPLDDNSEYHGRCIEISGTKIYKGWTDFHGVPIEHSTCRRCVGKRTAWYNKWKENQDEIVCYIILFLALLIIALILK